MQDALVQTFPSSLAGACAAVPENLAAIQGEIGLQALMIGYANIYWLLGALCVLLVPLVGLIGPTKPAA